MNNTNNINDNEHWDLIIRPESSWLKLNLKELWQYKDLLVLFVKRDIVAVYTQTILGPIWFILQPLLQSLIFNFVFAPRFENEIVGLPYFIFSMAGLTAWNYFSECINNTSATFINNASIYGKVYFPRLISPLSVVISGLIKFLIQFAFFICVYFYYASFNGMSIQLNWTLIFIPLIVLCLGLLGLSFGIIISSLTTKYRDLRFLVGFGVQLWMFLSPVIFKFKSEKAMLNPVAPLLDLFKYAFLGNAGGSFQPFWLCYSLVFTLVLFVVSVFIFNKVEKNFIDTV